jgi:hypothetical protein
MKYLIENISITSGYFSLLLSIDWRRLSVYQRSGKANPDKEIFEII